MTMTLQKLEKSLILRVEQRLAELLPDAEVRATRRSIRIKWNDLDCEVTVRALADACISEDRGTWGAIAGGFCNMVASRVHAHFGRHLATNRELARVVPVLVADNPIEDALIAAAAPTPALDIASFPWLDGFRLEFEYRCEGDARRVFRRDLETLRTGVDGLCVAALDNVAEAVSSLKFSNIGESEGDGALLCLSDEPMAPALLASDAGQKAILDALHSYGVTGNRVLAAAPRNDRIYACSMKSKAAMSRLAAAAWADFETEDDSSYPLSARLFTVSDRPEVKFLDHGVPFGRFPEWRQTLVGPVQFAIPESWQVSLQGDRWVIWTSAGGPRVRVRQVEGHGGSPLAGYELADRVRQKQHQTRVDRGEPDIELGHGFFNGLPWTSVDTATHDGIATASLVVVLQGGIVVLQTEIPNGAPASEQVTLQKIISTLRPSPPVIDISDDDE